MYVDTATPPLPPRLPPARTPQLCYLSAYQGRSRGVLVQLGSEQHGYFPLGLFDEAKAAPPPPLAGE